MVLNHDHATCVRDPFAMASAIVGSREQVVLFFQPACAKSLLKANWRISRGSKASPTRSSGPIPSASWMDASFFANWASPLLDLPQEKLRDDEGVMMASTSMCGNDGAKMAFCHQGPSERLSTSAEGECMH